MELMFIIETEQGIIKNLKFDTEFEALNYIEEHNLKNAIVRIDDGE
ncbi:MAG: hypothetical protein LIR50_19220 [Bacillota bacterium]|nr:hypothetical protein [Bacillota bacterium]